MRGIIVPLRLLVVMAAWCAATPQASAQDAPPPLPRLAIEDDGTGSALPLIDRAESAAIPAAVRVILPGASADPALDAHLTSLRQRRVPLWLSIPAPATAADVDAWRTALRLTVDRHAATLAVLEVAVDRQPSDVVAFAVRVAATEARASTARVRLALGGDAMNDSARRPVVYTADLAPYVDLLTVSESGAAGVEEWLRRIDPAARILITNGGQRPGDPAAERPIVDAVVDELGTAFVSHSWRTSAFTEAALRALAPLTDVLSHEFTVVEGEKVGLKLAIGQEDVTTSLRHRLLFDTDTFSTLLIYWGAARPDALAVSLRVPIEGTPGVLDLLNGERSSLAEYTRDRSSSEARGLARLTGRPMLVNFNEGADAIGEQTGVSAERRLSVGEIISRHQRQQLAQDRLVRSYIANARMQQYFRPTETDPGYDVVTENRYFVAEDGIEWEELSFAVNNRKFSGERPPYPLLQPEKVLALPLQLRFDEGYRYRLAGTGLQHIDGFECYEVRFEPLRDDPSLYRGTVWIDRKTFARIRLHAVQGELPGMVISDEETVSYRRVTTIGNQPIFLLSALQGTQNVLIAGRTIRMDKRVTFSDFRVNDGDFVELRASARQSDRVMYRETPAGLRYYVKRDGERVVSEHPTASVRALAVGLVADPSYAFPLPIFGINYIDFSFGNSDTQLAMLFAGVLAAGNVQRPQFGSKRLDASLDFFAIAAPSSERVYEAAGERESERLLTWPLTTGLNLGWRVTPFQTMKLQYQLRFDGYVRDTTTSEEFVVPSSTVTNGIGGSWEYNRGGYSVVLNGTWFNRAGWKPWGEPQADGSLLATPASYVKYTASVSRDILIDAFQKIHLNAAWFGGRDLDRFVKYQFGMFDSTRIHGVPAAVRFGELAMARGSYSVNVFDQYRLDLFLDQAWGKEEHADRNWQAIPGIGAAFNLPAPWNTILRADVGKSWLPDRYGSLGSMSLQIMLLKPLR
ncbi:MAG TPA: hypothetical protein VFV95_02050 [Vicinamibacterales bacterium]|nr:hypothetical protein [Vicinamibacterales bacterium]